MEKVSQLNIANSIMQGPVPTAAFIAADNNIFPKMCDRINETAWELWYLNGISMTEGGSAFAMGLTRNARSVERGGFCVEVHALFSNNTNLSLELLFKESNFVEREGAITGTWHSPGSEDVVKVVFQVLADLSSASLRFDVPGKVTGTIDLTALNKVPMLPSKEEDAQLGPCVHYLRGLPIATVIADLVFGDVKDVQGAKILRLRTHDQVVGGMDRL
ncbi:hypothetical protein GGS24DRAFT_502048 [Hypoxylon argillaceum]|nr:hypothetical protein GGS24DRAFT_502048 [Hypoxylon argillaceum]